MGKHDDGPLDSCAEGLAIPPHVSLRERRRGNLGTRISGLPCSRWRRKGPLTGVPLYHMIPINHCSLEV